jgi:hypothetical protein
VNFYVDYNTERERAFHHVTKFNKLNLNEHSFSIQIQNPYQLFLTYETHNTNQEMFFGNIQLNHKKFILTDYERLITKVNISKKFMLNITNTIQTTDRYKTILDQNFYFPIIKLFLDRTDELFLELHNKTIYPSQEKKFVSKVKKSKDFWLQYLNVNPKIQYFSIATELANDKLSWHMCKPLYQDNIITNFK